MDFYFVLKTAGATLIASNFAMALGAAGEAVAPSAPPPPPPAIVAPAAGPVYVVPTGNGTFAAVTPATNGQPAATLGYGQALPGGGVVWLPAGPGR